MITSMHLVNGFNAVLKNIITKHTFIGDLTTKSMLKTKAVPVMERMREIAFTEGIYVLCTQIL